MNTPLRRFVFRAIAALVLFLFPARGNAAAHAAVFDDDPGASANPADTLNMSYLQIDLGGESFVAHDPAYGKSTAGLTAIMLDVDARINRRFSLFAAFHFDSEVWHGLINLPRAMRTDEARGPGLDLEVEEFFVSWSPLFPHLELTAGRMFSVSGYANQLHLADFHFNMKPRIFSAYWGDNHGLSLDGLSLKLSGRRGRAHAAFFVEAARNDQAREHSMLLTVADLRFGLEGFDLGFRGFAYADFHSFDHPLYQYAPEASLPLPGLGGGDFGLHALGGGMNAMWPMGAGKNLFFQAEWMQRNAPGESFGGGYAFVVLDHSERFSSSLMLQQLEVAAFSRGQWQKQSEKALTLGLSYYPVPYQRFRLEYARFSQSLYYDRLLLLKWTFFIDLTGLPR